MYFPRVIKEFSNPDFCGNSALENFSTLYVFSLVFHVLGGSSMLTLLSRFACSVQCAVVVPFF